MNFDDRWDIPIVLPLEETRTKEKDKGIIDKEQSEIQRQEQEITRDADFIKNFLSLGIKKKVANSIHDKYMNELFKLSEPELSKAREFTPEKILEWYFNPEPISLYGFLLMEYLRVENLTRTEVFEEKKNEIFDKEEDVFSIDDTEPEKTTFIEAPGRILESDLGVRLPSQDDPILDISNVPELDIEVPKIELPKTEPVRAYSVEHILEQKLELLDKLEMGELKKWRATFERRRKLTERTKQGYEIYVRTAREKLGEDPTVSDVLEYILESARNDTESSYFHNLVGIREGYPELYKKIEQVLPRKSERENMKLHAKLSGYEVEVSRPIVKARTEEIDDMVLKQITDNFHLQWHRDAVRLIEITGVRRSEIQSMTMKLGSKRDAIELEWTVSKQKNGRERKNKIKILKSHFPNEFKELGEILTRTNGSKSIRQSSFERVQIFTGSQTPRALGDAFKRTRNRVGADGELYKLHSLRHQHATDLRKNGIDVEGIAIELGHSEAKNSMFYGVVV